MHTDPSPAERARAARAGLAAAGLWLLIEFGIRDIAYIAIFARTIASGKTPDLRKSAIFSFMLLWPAMLALGLVFLRLSRRRGLSWSALGYRSWRMSILPGVLAAALAWGLIRGTSDLTEALFGTGMVDQFVAEAKAGGFYAMVLALLPANGVLGPVVEELAWRGYIQTCLIQGWGPRTGIAVTALLFALKHTIVDLSFYRIISLVVGGFVYGIVGYRWGTSASTVVHVLGNTEATIEVMLEIWR